VLTTLTDSRPLAHPHTQSAYELMPGYLMLMWWKNRVEYLSRYDLDKCLE